MHDEQRLIDGYLDETLLADDFARCETLVKSSPEFARRLAVASLLHDRLRSESVMAMPTTSIAERASSLGTPATWGRTWAALTAIAAAFLIGFFLRPDAAVSRASAANLAVERMIEAANRQIDRIYHIRVTDFGSQGPPPVVPSDRLGRKPGIDGAELFVRGPEQFVLLRTFGDGTKFVTGSDGEIGWAAAPTGHVHLSRDVRRFRRAVPGEHEEIPFLDLEKGLHALQRDFELTLAEQTDLASGQNRLDAVKKPHVRGGPTEIQIWFDADGTAHRIRLVGLPAEDGESGTRTVVLELQPERSVATDFFRHESHHAADRPLDWE